MAHAEFARRVELLGQVRNDALSEPADGYAERRSARAMVEAELPGKQITLGADKGYDTREFIDSCRAL